MTDNDEKETTSAADDNLGVLNKDASHPFDQTNGIVDGLEGDADDPEVVEQQQNTDEPVDPLTGQGSDDASA